MTSPLDDLANLPPYQFEDLPTPRHLRILAIQGAPPDTEVVTCTLETLKDPKHHLWGGADASSTSEKGYEALSWCWGEGNPQYSIRIRERGQDFCFEVTEHLYEALRALRRNANDRYLWVDAICIDQKHTSERNQQVARMDEIYGDAKDVCIWLGKEDANSTLALNFIRKELQNVYNFDQLCKDSAHIQSWAAMLTFMKKPWFGRRWIVQEVSLAQKATVYCGSESVSWDELGSAISLFVDVDTSVQQLSALAKKEADFNHADDFFKEVPALGATSLISTTNRLFKRSVGGVAQRTSTLEDIVARLAMFESTEPRDTIYALLALAKDSYPTVEGRDEDPVFLRSTQLTPNQVRIVNIIGRLLPQPYKQRYDVDYAQPVVDVYQQFIAFAISRADPTRALDIICRPFAQEFKRGEDVKFNKDLYNALSEEEKQHTVPLPSWIANRREVPWVKQIQADQRAVWSMKRQRGDPFVSTPDAVSYSAAGFRKYDKDKVRFRKRGDDYSMFVEGFQLDVITTVKPASQLGNIPAGWIATGKKHKERDFDTLWKTLVADRSPKGHAPLYYKNTIETVLKEAPPHATFDIAEKIRQSPSKVVAEVLRQIQATIWNRRLVETKRGFLALTPSDAKVGDVICIIYGCTVPVVLRRIKKTPGQIDSDIDADKVDRLQRDKRLEPKIERLISHLKTRYRERKGVSIKRASWLPQRVMFVAVASLLIIRLFDDRLAASILASVALPHLWVDTEALTSASRTSRQQLISSEAAATTFVVGMGAAFLLIAVAGWDVLVGAGIMTIYIAVLPELLPLVLRDRYMRLCATIYASPTRIRTWLLPGHPANSKSASGRRGPVDPPPLPEYWKLVGESYVHKMMNGEAIEWQNAEEVKKEIFELR